MTVLLQRLCSPKRNIVRTGEFLVAKLGGRFRYDFVHCREDSNESDA